MSPEDRAKRMDRVLRRKTPEEREQLRQDARARYERGEYLTFDEFVAKHEKR